MHRPTNASYSPDRNRRRRCCAENLERIVPETRASRGQTPRPTAPAAARPGRGRRKDTCWFHPRDSWPVAVSVRILGMRANDGAVVLLAVAQGFGSFEQLLMNARQWQLRAGSLSGRQNQANVLQVLRKTSLGREISA